MDAPSAIARIESPVGILTLMADTERLLGMRIARAGEHAPHIGDLDHPILRQTVDQLTDWFAGKCQTFDLPLLAPASEDGARLRAGIASIPFGETLTYGMLASRTDLVARAVGQACKTNPYPIIIPCHRVVSTSGPEYYSGGNGPRTKSWLLDFEYEISPQSKRTRLI